MTRHKRPDTGIDTLSSDADQIGRLIAEIGRAGGPEPTNYRRDLLERLAERRALAGGFTGLADYAAALDGQPEELKSLARAWQAGEAGFAHEPPLWETLRQRCYEPLLADTTREELRIWVAGCAGGEEAYAQAMMLDEAARATGRDCRVTVFATEAHRGALEQAVAGAYPREATRDLGEERQARCFREEADGRLRVAAGLRSRVVFVAHDLLADEPFLRLDVVVCRGLLTRLTPAARERALPKLSRGLRAGGILVLGPGEGPGGCAADYEVVDGEHKVFRRKGAQIRAALPPPPLEANTQNGLPSPVAPEQLIELERELSATRRRLAVAEAQAEATSDELHALNRRIERENRELAQTNAELERLFSALDVGVLRIDRELRVVRHNPALSPFFRLSAADVGRSLEEIAYDLADRDALLADVRAALAGRGPRERELRDTAGRWLLRRVTTQRDGAGGIAGAILTFTRVDAIKRMQDKLDLAMDCARMVWWEWSLLSGEMRLHAGGPCILGYRIGDLSPRSDTWYQLSHPEDHAHLRATLDACLDGRISDWKCEHRYRDARGAWRWVLSTGRVIDRTEDGRPQLMIGTIQDMHARHLAEAEVAKLTHAVAQVGVSVIITDADGCIEYVNPCFCRTTGYSPEEVVGQNPRILKTAATPPAVFANLWATLASGADWRGELVNARKDGTLLHERVSISPVKDSAGRISHYIAVKEDISAERRAAEDKARLEHQLAQSQKMETLGALAGGIAHDFNNLLTAILGYTEMAAGELPETHPVRVPLDQIGYAGRRAADLARRILAFSRREPVVLAPIKLSRVLAEAQPVLRASLPATIDLRLRDATGDASVLGDALQLEQVLLNLCTNAAQALSASVGTIDISLERTDLTESPPLRVGHLSPGPHVRLTVSDTGPGIPPDVLPRIFEPFFTTKGVGEGTGLGLAIVHNIVVAHRGGIGLRSEPGYGAAFTLYLPETGAAPISRPPFVQAVPAPPPPPPVVATAGRQLAILDDEPGIAELTAMAVRAAGHSPVVFERPEDFLRAIRADTSSLDALLTDQTMPSMTGTELVRILRQEGIKLPVLLISGHAGLEQPSAPDGSGRLLFLPKPFDIAELHTAIRSLFA